MTLTLGAHDITTQESSQVRLMSKQFIVHPNWNFTTLTNDIALVKLPNPVTETAAIKIIKIATGKDTYAGSKGKSLLVRHF